MYAGVERVPGLTWRQVANVDDVAAVLAHGSRQRSTAATAMNSSSSRSHAILSVKICADPASGACSLLHLVDLAGRFVHCNAYMPAHSLNSNQVGYAVPRAMDLCSLSRSAPFRPLAVVLCLTSSILLGAFYTVTIISFSSGIGSM